MKKILFYFCLFLTSKNLGVDYPRGGVYDRPFEMYMSAKLIRTGDRIGHKALVEDDSLANTLGLVWFAGGIILVAFTDVPFASPFPVGKKIGLTDSIGSLSLMEDFHLSSYVDLVASGRIDARYGSIILNGTFNLLGKRISFVAGTSTSYPCFNGKGNIIDFSDGGEFNVQVTRMEINNVYLKNLTNNSINFTDGDSTLTFTRSTIKLGGNVCFNHDVVVQSGDLFITGTGHTICFNKGLWVKNGATLKMDYGTTFSLGYRGYIRTSGTGTFHFNGCDIEIGENYGLGSEINNGFNLKNGRVLFQNRVRINDDSNHKHFIIGEHSQARVLSMANIVLDGTTTFSIL